VGGQASIRGYLIQTLVGVLEAFDVDQAWQSVIFEPDHLSEKIDILWCYENKTKAVQVKSSQNQFTKRDVERWALLLESSRGAEEYELILIGPCSQGVIGLTRVGNVSIPPPKNLDIPGLLQQAAEGLAQFLESQNLSAETAEHRRLLARALVTELNTYSADSTPLSRADVLQLLTKWISQAGATRTVLRPRGVVIKKLKRLSTGGFGTLRSLLPECRAYVAAEGAVSPRVDQLVEWAEGEEGFGLDEVRRIAEELWGEHFFD